VSPAQENLKLSETNQCTQFLQQDQKQWEEAAMMLAISIQPNRKKAMTKKTKKDKQPGKKNKRNPTRETSSRILRACSFEEKVGLPKLPIKD
jgi:hypothetical protein